MKRRLSGVLLLAALAAFGVTAPAGAQTFTSVGQWGRAGGDDGTFGSDAGEMFDPEKLVVDADRRVYVSDVLNHRIQVFDADGGYLYEFGQLGTAAGEFNSPRGIVFDPASGDLFIVDSLNDRIQRFNKDGTFVSQFGSRGSGNGQFSFPRDIAIDSDGNLYVSDGDNHRVQVFDTGGTYVTQWGSFGSADDQFQFPRGVAADPDSAGVYVVDSFNHRVMRFAPDGTLRAKYGRNGGDGSFGNLDGEFNTPRAVVPLPGGSIRVADTGNDRIHTVVDSTTFATYGELGVGPDQLNTPRGMAAYDFGMSGPVFTIAGLMVADSGNHRIVVLGTSALALSRTPAAPATRDETAIPFEVELIPDRADPRRLTAVARYQLPEAADVEMELRDSDGKFVRTLDRSVRQAGIHTVEWSGVQPGQSYHLRAAGSRGERTAVAR